MIEMKTGTTATTAAATNGGEHEDDVDGGIPAVLQAETEISLKFACLVRFIDDKGTSRKQILDAVLHLVCGNNFHYLKRLKNQFKLDHCSLDLQFLK